MKKLLVVLLLSASSASAQILLENTYSNGAQSTPPFGIVNLSSSGYKYVESDTGQIILYNLNHTIFRTITIPYQGGIFVPSFRLEYISEELFNLNPADIEYVICYTDDTTNRTTTRVYDENGNIIFSRDSFTLGGTLSPGGAQGAIAYTSGGVKMMLLGRFGVTDVEVYSLPGILPCNECTGGVITGIAQSPSIDNNQQQQLPNPYPNPTSNTTTIPYQLPAGVNTGTIIIYDLLGNEVRRYEVGRAFNTIEIAVGELAQGTYTYSLMTTEGVIRGNKFVVNE